MLSLAGWARCLCASPVPVQTDSLPRTATHLGCRHVDVRRALGGEKGVHSRLVRQVQLRTAARHHVGEARCLQRSHDGATHQAVVACHKHLGGTGCTVMAAAGGGGWCRLVEALCRWAGENAICQNMRIPCRRRQHSAERKVETVPRLSPARTC